MSWTLTYNDTEQTFDEWGLALPRRKQASLSAGVVTLLQPGAAFDGETLFAIDSLITIKLDGAVWHVGPVIRTPREGSSDKEWVSYEIADPWWYLDNLVVSQGIKIGSAATSADTTRVALFGEFGGGSGKLTVEQVVTWMVSLATAAGASMQLALAGDFGFSPVTQELRDPTCGEVIRQALGWCPDASSGWDYSTSPPTLRISRRAAAAVRSIDLASHADVQLVSITARDDLRRDKVVLQYETTSEDDGEVFSNFQIDSAGDGSEFRTLRATIPLSGSRITRQKQYIKVRTPTPSETTFWIRHIPSLNDAVDLVISSSGSAPADGGDGFSYEIVSGAIPGWMDSDDVSGPMRFYAKASYKIQAADGSVIEYKNDPVSVVLKCTSLTTATYSTVTGVTEAEAVPGGVAAQLLAAVGVLQYEGSVRIPKDELAFIARTGDVLNLTNGRAAWATMAAPVQSVDEDVETGTTVIGFGVASHLGPQDLVEMLRSLRTRPASLDIIERRTAKKSDGGSVAGGKDGGGENGAGHSKWVRAVIKSDDGTRAVTMDGAAGVKVENSTAARSADLQAETVRLLFADGAGNSLDLQSATMRLLITDAAGNTTAVDAAKVQLSNPAGTVSSTLTQSSLVFENALGDTCTFSVDGVTLARAAGKNTTLDEDGLSSTDGSGKEVAITAADGLSHTNGSKTAELEAATLTLNDGAGNTIVAVPESGLTNETPTGQAQIGGTGGIHLDDGSSGTVTIAVVSGKSISFKDTDSCSDTGDTLVMSVLRSDAS